MTDINALASRLWENTRPMPKPEDVRHRVRHYYSSVADATSLECLCGWHKVVSSYDFTDSKAERIHISELVKEHERAEIQKFEILSNE